MKVVQVEDGLKVEPNGIYVISPNADMSILGGQLQLLEPVAPRGLRMPIDFFFRHLAVDQKENVVAILLSGMGTDGTLGLRAVKEHFGMVMVQDPASAKYDGMPRSAIGTGLVDYVAPAEELPAKLIQYVTHQPIPSKTRIDAKVEPSGALQKIFVLLRARTGNDFSRYKKATTCRRIERRMGVHQIDTLARYVRLLQEYPEEADLLHKELLIGVTNFFRDPGLFDFLKEKAFPQLLQERPQGSPLRVWNPGCSTGEETYSLAIVLKECLEDFCGGDRPLIQMFGTDLDKDAVEKARQGVFSAAVTADVSAQRLERFFVREDNGYRIKKDIRDMVVFAPQNVLDDPPFTKLDVLCCRNLLIYLNVETQKKLVSLAHYVLSPGGILILGPAEGIGDHGDMFAPLDKKWKVFRRRELLERAMVELPSALPRHEIPSQEPLGETRKAGTNLVEAAQRSLLDAYAPSAVVINPQGDIIYVNGRTGKYLEPSSGKVNVNIFAMARQGLRQKLDVAIQDAIQRQAAVTVHGVKVKSNGGYTTIDVSVKPFAEPPLWRHLFLVVFEEVPAARSKEAGKKKREPFSRPSATAAQLEQELRRSKEHLQSTVEEMEATQEELKSTNEEMQSNNEELQSTNEELTTSKEELQSLNEEMQTVNAELQAKIEDLSHVNDDMKNLLNGIDVATIFLDNDLAIKRFTSQTTKLINLIASDVGRPIGHFVTNLKYDRLIEDAGEVLRTFVPKEVQIQASDDRWYHLRVLPYRTADNVTDGVVMTFADITAMKRLEKSLRQQQVETEEARAYAENIIATVREPLVVMDNQLRIVSANHSFYEMFQVTKAETAGQVFYQIGHAQWDIPALRGLLEGILSQNTPFENFRVESNFPGIGPRVLLLNARRMASGDPRKGLILLAMEDVTGSSKIGIPSSTPSR